MSSGQTTREAKRPRRKPYRSPRLRVYGDLRRLTRGGMGGMGGMMMMNAKGGMRGDGGMMAPMTRL